MTVGDGVGDHGGDLAGAEVLFGRPPEPWLDLSTGINPWSYPVPPQDAALWHRLPGRERLDDLLIAAARCYGCPPDALVAGPGSQALIQCLPRVRPPDAVQIVGFTYAEHARCWRRAGHSVAMVDSLDEAAGPVVVVVNPNNPDGRMLPPERLLPVADRLAAKGGLLVVDEAFAEVAPPVSVAPWAGRPGLCVLRSFGKFFGLAGVRLGFALGPAGLVRALAEELGPWAVSGPALGVGLAALADTGWQEAMRARLGAASADLDRVLARRGLRVVGGTSLYRLASHPQAGVLYEHLARRGILVRAFEGRRDWLRFGLPGDGGAMARLDAALGAFAGLGAVR